MAEGLKEARLEEVATFAQISRYLGMLKSLRLILVQPLGGRSWLALPANRSEAAQKLGLQGPMAVHLVDGDTHTSAIMKSDLTVMSAGICLSGQDQKFDLQSLVAVVEARNREEHW